jgi:hypothetical protein
MFTIIIRQFFFNATYLSHQIGCVRKNNDDTIPRPTMTHEASGTAGGEPSTMSASVIKLIITMVDMGGGAHTLYDSECVASKGKVGGRGAKKLEQRVAR